MFGDKSIAVIETQIHGLLETYKEKIDAAIKNRCAEDPLPVTLSVVIDRLGKSLNIQTSIWFVSGRVRGNSDCATVTEEQPEGCKG